MSLLPRNRKRVQATITRLLARAFCPLRVIALSRAAHKNTTRLNHFATRRVVCLGDVVNMEEQSSGPLFDGVVFTTIPSEKLSVGHADGVRTTFGHNILSG